MQPRNDFKILRLAGEPRGPWPMSRTATVIGFAIHERGHLQDQKRHRRRQAAAARKQTWLASNRDLVLQHAAAALLHSRPRPPQPPTIVDSADDDDVDQVWVLARLLFYFFNSPLSFF